MKKTIAMTMAVLVWGAVEAAGRQPMEAPAVRVRINYAIDPRVQLDYVVFGMAQMKASELLAEAGIRLEWRRGDPDQGDIETGVIGMTFVPVAPPEFQSGSGVNALASAKPYSKSRLDPGVQRSGRVLYLGL